MADRDVVLFHGGDDGYGDSINRGRNSYNWVHNWDCSPVGTSTPSASPAKVIMSTVGLWPQNPIASAFEWRNANNQPELHWFYGDGAAAARHALYNTSFALETTVVDPWLKAVLYRNDGSDADAEVAWMCNGAANDNIHELLKDGTGPRNTSHDVKYDGLAVVGGDLWGWAGNKIRKLDLDADPGLTASWATATAVGIPSYDINEVVDLGNSAVVLSGSGVFLWDPQIVEWRNLTPAITPHPDNGKGGFTDGRGRVYYPTVQGDLLVLTFGFQSQQAPVRSHTINRDTPWGRMSALTADMEHVYAAIEGGATRTQGISGFKVLSDNGGVFTDHTTNLTDGAFNSVADWELLTETADQIWVGADEPFHGVYFRFQPGQTRTTAQGDVPKIAYGLSGGGYQDETALPGAAFASHDGTSSFSKDGLITIQNDNSEDLLAISAAWTKTTVDSKERYWMRITPPSSTALTGVKAISAHLVPYRPPLGNQGNFPRLAYSLSSTHPKILVGTWRGEELVWQDTWTLDDAEIEQLVVTQQTSDFVKSRRALAAISREAVTFIPIGADGSALRQPYMDFGSSGNTLAEHAICFSGHSFGVPSREKVVRGLQIHMPHLQPEDEVYFWYWWDDDADRTYEHGPFTDGSSVITVPPLQGQGRVLYTVLGWKDKAQNPINPQLTLVEVPKEMWDVVGDIDNTRHEAIASPMSR